MPALLFALLLETASSQAEDLPASRTTRSFSLRAGVPRFSVQLYGTAGDALSQDPAREEDFLAPELQWFVTPRWTLHVQAAKALRAGSDDQLAVSASCAF